MQYKKPNVICYRIAQAVSWFVATFIFKRKILRNEIKGKKGPFVVIANHEAAYDFVNLIGATSRPMSFVISKSFFSTLPIQGFMRKMGVIPKQQFQTSVKDLKRMKTVIDHGDPVVIYPAGLMCEDGLSTPIPGATYKFLRWLGADVYVARCSGTYFAMPKWTKGMRPGRTYMDIYQLFTKDALAHMTLEEIREKTDEALLFDAYREQETFRVKYKNNHIVEGLENVLYQCPHCKAEFSMGVRNGSTIFCGECGYAQESDEYAFLHNRSGMGEEIRYVSDWSRMIYEDLKEKIQTGQLQALTAAATIRMVDEKKCKFTEVGQGTLSLSREGFLLSGKLRGEEVQVAVPIGNIPTLPFSPGNYLEVQDGAEIYRCCLEDGKLVMKFINMVKIFHELAVTV